MKKRVLIFGNLEIMTARAVWGCLDAGLDVVQVWIPKRTSRIARYVDLVLGFLRPGWSVSAALRRSGGHLYEAGPLRKMAKLENIVREIGIDFLLVASFPYIVPASLIELLGGNAYNIHPSLLPEFRGKQPLFWMVITGEANRVGGVTLHKLVAEVDEGAIVGQRAVPLQDYNLRGWQIRLAKATYDLVVNDLLHHLHDPKNEILQSRSGSYYPVVEKKHLQIDTSRSAEELIAIIKVLGASFELFLKVDDRAIFLGSKAQVIGPLQGPPFESKRWLEFDAADFRLRVHLRTGGAALKDKFHHLTNLLKTRP